MTRRGILIPAVPAIGVAIYLINEMGAVEVGSWLAGCLAFTLTFSLVSLYVRHFWKLNSYPTWQDTLNLLPRSKGK